MAPDAYKREYLVVVCKGGVCRQWNRRFETQHLYIVDDIYADCDTNNDAECAAAREAWLEQHTGPSKVIWKRGDASMLGVCVQALRDLGIAYDEVDEIRRGAYAWWRN